MLKDHKEYKGKSKDHKINLTQKTKITIKKHIKIICRCLNVSYEFHIIVII